LAFSKYSRGWRRARAHSGQTLFRTGARTAGLYEIVTGKVRLVRVDRSGREAVLQVAAPGDTLAEASLFSSTYHCDAIALYRALAGTPSASPFDGRQGRVSHALTDCATPRAGIAVRAIDAA